MEITGFETDIEIYPCSCGHCSSCGLQVMATITPQEQAELDRIAEEEEMRWELTDDGWVKLW